MLSKNHLAENDLLNLGPNFKFEAVCPCCQSLNERVSDVEYLGIHYLANYTCDSCGILFCKTLPQGHGKILPITFSRDLKYKVVAPKAQGWLSGPLFQVLVGKDVDVPSQINRVVKYKCENVILINCLDTCYGHIFYKFISIQYYQRQYPELGIIAVIPKSVAWLCSDNVAEQWVVDVPVQHLDRRLSGLNQFLNETLLEFGNVFLATQYLNPDFEKVDFEKMLKTPKFDLSRFEKIPPVVTLVLREDRFWFDHGLDRFLWKLSVKLKVKKYSQIYFVIKQNRKFGLLAKMLKKNFPDISIYATGVGTKGTMKHGIIDKREELSDDPMQRWALLYGQSHVVIGVHGSNLLVPTALSGGFVEICTEDKIVHISEEIAMIRHPKYMHFLGRFIHETCSLSLLYKHVSHILEDFKSVRIEY